KKRLCHGCNIVKLMVSIRLAFLVTPEGCSCPKSEQRTNPRPPRELASSRSVFRLGADPLALVKIISPKEVSLIIKLAFGIKPSVGTRRNLGVRLPASELGGLVQARGWAP